MKVSEIKKEDLYDSIHNIIWYDGNYVWLKDLRDDMVNFKKTHDEYANYPNPFDHAQWHTEQHVIYMLLAGLFGDWGTSIRSAWIEDIDGCIEFINFICEECWKWDKERKEQPPTVANPDTPTEPDFKYFTAEQVRNMSQKEVKENYQDIMKSMKKW